MNIKQTVTYVLFLFLFSIALSVQAETKKLYGIQGPSLIYRQLSNSPKTYEVNGEVYVTHPPESAKEYTKKGIASYYHHKFNGRPTSTGEPYDSTLYTAAHKTLPLNSYAVVTNMYNKRKVIVRINDRGPFAKDRIIDLSHAAAKEIGIVNYGMGLVQIEALHVHTNGDISGPGSATLAKSAKNVEGLKRLKPNAKNNASTDENRIAKKDKAGNKKESYKIKMVNIPSKKEAEKIIKQLSSKNIKAEMIAQGKKYNVHFGPFKSKNEIEKLKTQLRQWKHSEPLIVYAYNK